MCQSAELDERLNQLKKDRSILDQDVQEFDNKIDKSQIKLSNIKSNKEYKAVLKEIEDLKKGKSAIEDKAIQLMELIDEMETKRHETQHMEPQIKDHLEKNKKAVKEELKKFNKALKSLEKEKIQFTQGLDQELLKKYLFLKDRKNGQAVSSVIGGVCQTCHMGIPPQKFNELIRGNSLLTCPHCNRIIYWGEEQHFQESTDNAGDQT
jgi:predicted  nucleic acid-binding Zn-ribbon protein